MDDSGGRVSRRAVLSTATATAIGSAGCVRRTRNIFARDAAAPLELEIKVVPTDTNPLANRIANHLAEHLEAVGVNVHINPVETEELYRQVLINHNFDLYVAQFPQLLDFDPDILYAFLHSSFVIERGWQNPLGLTDIDIDELLDRQRRTTGDERTSTVWALQDRLAETQPFVPIVLPESLTAVRTDRFSGWSPERPTSPIGLLGLDRTDEDIDTLQLATTDSRITQNRNPIAAEFRQYGTLISLLYDPLARTDNGLTVPWLAASIDWSSSPVTADIALRDEQYWHDGTELTAEDIEFTFRFLQDTSLGNAENPVPTPRYRGRSTLIDVENTTVLDETTIRIAFDDVTVAAAENALQIPILPEHVWEEQAEIASIAGIEIDIETTEALVWNNPEPIGSGPFEFESATDGESLVMSIFDEHFLNRQSPPEIPERLRSGAPFETLEIDVVASDSSAIELISNAEADATVAPLGPDVVARIEDSPVMDLIRGDSHAFYHVGVNLRRDPFGNPNFRRMLARSIDKNRIADEAFMEFAQPIASPFADTAWMHPDLEWDGEDPAQPFYRTQDGFDHEAARESLREAGFQFDADGQLILQEQ